MKKLNKKGVTLLEIIISVSLIALILVFLMTLYTDIRYKHTLTRSRGTNLINQAFLLQNFQENFMGNNLRRVTFHPPNRISFHFHVGDELNLSWNVSPEGGEVSSFDNAVIGPGGVRLCAKEFGGQKIIYISIPLTYLDDNYFTNDLEFVYIEPPGVSVETNITDTNC